MTLDDFLKWFFGTFLKGIVTLLHKAALVAIFLGFLGYFLGSLKGVDLSGIRLSPISDKSLQKIAPTPPAR